MKEKIILPKKAQVVRTNSTVALTQEAFDAVQEVMTRTSLPIKRVVSAIIIQAVEKDLIVFEELEG